MPIQDINGNNLVYHSNFDNTIQNIEFCGGKSNFGKREFPLCYSTDITYPQSSHFMEFPNDYETQDCHYLDGVCDLMNVPFTGRTFDNVIICNPYDIGFRGRFETKQFLEVTGNLLNVDGMLTLLGSSKSTWSKYRNFEKHYTKLVADQEMEDMFRYNLEPMNAQHPFRINYTFHVTGFDRITEPDQIIRITKIA